MIKQKKQLFDLQIQFLENNLIYFIIMIDIHRELAKFNNIRFFDESHKYLIDGKEAISVTKIISKFEKPFDSAYWSQKKADEEGVSKQVILDRWRLKADIACEKGSAIHSYVENLLYGKVFPYPEQKIRVFFKGNDPVKEKYDAITILIDKFVNTIKGRMLPIRSEVVIGDPEFGICGMIDQLFYNEKTQQLEIWDWKSNEEITIESRYRMLAPISHIPDSKLDKYSLQTSLYRYIIEKNTNLKLGDSHLVWFNEDNDNYVWYACKDYRKEAELILRYYFQKK